MAIAQTNTRVGPDAVIGLAFQDAAGSPATPSDFLNVEKITFKPNSVDLKFRGTQQTLFKRQEPVRRVAVDPELEIDMYVTNTKLRILLQSAFGADPYASTNLSGSVSIAGDTGTNISQITFSNPIKGISATDSGIVYINITVDGGSTYIGYYMSATYASLVGHTTMPGGSGAGTIVADNNSGLAGSIIVNPGPANQSGITAFIEYLKCPYHTHFDKYLTVATWDGFDRYTIEDMVVQKITLSSKDGEAMMASVALKGGAIAKSSSAIQGTFDTGPYFAHNSDLEIMHSTAYNIELGSLNNELVIENTVNSYRANASAPVAQIKQGCTVTGKVSGQLGDELNTIYSKVFRTPSEGISWDAMSMKWTVASDTTKWARFRMGNVHYEVDSREISGEDEQKDLDFNFESFYSTTRDAIEVLVSF